MARWHLCGPAIATKPAGREHLGLLNVRFARILVAALAAVVLPQVVPAAARDARHVAIPVEAQPVAVEPIVEKVAAIGTLRANRSVMVRPEIAGLLTGIGFKDSTDVKKGEVLYHLDDAIVRAQLQQAQAALALSEQNYKRAMALYRKGSGTAQARDQAISALDADRASVALAEARLAQTVVHAPFGGVAGMSKVDVGAYLTAGEDLVSLDDVDTMKIDFDVPERYARFISVGEKVSVSPDALPGKTFDGTVQVAATRIDPDARTLGVRAVVPNPQRLLRPGMFTRVTVAVGEQRRAIVVPEQAIVPQGESLIVYRVVGGKAVRTVVTVGLRQYGKAEIVKGLAPGEEIVTAGQQKIQDGSRVEVISQKKPAMGAAAIDPPSPNAGAER